MQMLNLIKTNENFCCNIMAVSEFGLSMLILILLNNYMFIEIFGICMIISALETNKMHFKAH